MRYGTLFSESTSGCDLTQGCKVSRHIDSIFLGNAQVGHGCIWLDVVRVAQPQNHVVLRVGQLARNQCSAGHSHQRRPDVGRRAGHAWDGVAGAAGILVQRLLAAHRVGSARERGVNVSAAGGDDTLPWCLSHDTAHTLRLGHLCISLWREIWQVLQEGHHIPYLTIGQAKLPRRHAGKADAMAGYPVQLTRVEILRRIDQWARQWLHALANVALRNAGRAVALRTFVMKAGGATADHGLILQWWRLDVARVKTNRAMHGDFENRKDGLQMLLRRANVVKTCPNETRSTSYAKGGECCNRSEDGADSAHGILTVVDKYRSSAQRVLSWFAPVLLAGLLSACSGDPSQLYEQQDRQQAARGKLLLAQYQCGSCHVIPGVAASRGAVGPTLQAFSRRSYIAGNVPNQPAALALWLVDPKAIIPATTMPSMGVSPTDARAMAAYLHTLQ